MNFAMFVEQEKTIYTIYHFLSVLNDTFFEIFFQKQNETSITY